MAHDTATRIAALWDEGEQLVARARQLGCIPADIDRAWPAVARMIERVPGQPHFRPEAGAPLGLPLAQQRQLANAIAAALARVQVAIAAADPPEQPEPGSLADVFGEAIHVHPRAQLLADGDLVALDDRLVREAGFTCPVAVSRRVFADLIALTPAAKAAGNDETGRAWDVLHMARLACMRRGEQGSRRDFALLAVVSRRRPSRVKLYAHLGPGDRGEPVVTIMYPDED